MNQHTAKICIECNKEVDHYLNRGRCKTCYARLYRAVIQSDSSRTKAIGYRKKYRELNREHINKYWRNKRGLARKYRIAFEKKNGKRKTKPRSEEYKAKVAATYKTVCDYKLELGCIDCGYNKHPEVLDFDHIRDKLYNISALARSNANPDTLWAEIAKCVVRCANCHRIMTFNRRMELKASKVLQ